METDRNGEAEAMVSEGVPARSSRTQNGTIHGSKSNGGSSSLSSSTATGSTAVAAAATAAAAAGEEGGGGGGLSATVEQQLKASDAKYVTLEREHEALMEVSIREIYALEQELQAYRSAVGSVEQAQVLVDLRVRFHIIRNARIENVGKSQSCMVSKLRIIWKQTVGRRDGDG